MYNQYLSALNNRTEPQIFCPPEPKAVTKICIERNGITLHRRTETSD